MIVPNAHAHRLMSLETENATMHDKAGSLTPRPPRPVNVLTEMLSPEQYELAVQMMQVR